MLSLVFRLFISAYMFIHLPQAHGALGESGAQDDSVASVCTVEVQTEHERQQCFGSMIDPWSFKSASECMKRGAQVKIECGKFDQSRTVQVRSLKSAIRTF